MTLTAMSFFILYAGAKQGEAKEVTPAMIAEGSFRINERVLDSLRVNGVPPNVSEQLKTRKNAEDKFIVNDKKFSGDKSFTAAFETIKYDLKADGLPDDVWRKLKDGEIQEGDLSGDGSFGAALETSLKLEGRWCARRCPGKCVATKTRPLPLRNHGAIRKSVGKTRPMVSSNVMTGICS
jgi:hypothetical protein